MDAKELTHAKFLYLEALQDDPRLSKFDCRVATKLVVRFYNRKADAAWPGTGTLAELLGKDRRHIQRSIRKLKALGWLAVEPGGGRSRSNRYRPIWAMGRVEVVALKGAKDGAVYAPPESAPTVALKCANPDPKTAPNLAHDSFEVNPIKTPRALEGDFLPSKALNKNQKDSLVGFSSIEIPKPNTESRSGIPNTETRAPTIELVASTPAPAAETKKSARQESSDGGGEFDLGEAEPEIPDWKLRAFRTINGDLHPSGVSKYHHELREQELEFNTTFPNLPEQDRRKSDFWMLTHPETTSKRVILKLQAAHDAEVKAMMDRMERMKATKFATGLE